MPYRFLNDSELFILYRRFLGKIPFNLKKGKKTKQKTDDKSEKFGRYRFRRSQWKTFSKKRKRENTHLDCSGFKVIVFVIVFVIDSSNIGSVRDISFITNTSAFAKI
jgi:hypothetical protein